MKINELTTELKSAKETIAQIAKNLAETEESLKYSEIKRTKENLVSKTLIYKLQLKLSDAEKLDSEFESEKTKSTKYKKEVDDLNEEIKMKNEEIKMNNEIKSKKLKSIDNYLNNVQRDRDEEVKNIRILASNLADINTSQIIIQNK